MPLLQRAGRRHHNPFRIHPFLSGNGRWSRLLSHIWLKLHDAEPIEWPRTTIGTDGTIRNEYLQAVKPADRGDYSNLLALHQLITRRP